MKEKIRGQVVKTREATFEAGSENVYADLGFKDANQRMFKAMLAVKIAQLVEAKGLTQSQVAQRTALDQPKISRLMRGQLTGFSTDRLFIILNRLGHSIEVRISPKERAPGKSFTRVMLR
jgi:predicted XRE-type DNA-binding protein